MKLSLLGVFALSLLGPRTPAPPGAPTQDDGPEAALVEGFAQAGITLDLEREFVAIPASVVVRLELLEFLLCGPQGSTHEALFSTEIVPSLLNAALIATGAELGRNAAWVERDPAPTEEELAAGAPRFEVTYPEGDGFYLFAAWREGDQAYVFRMEDLLSNLATGRSMRRHKWVFLGSRFAALEEGGEETYVADVEQNLVNIAFFHEGNTLVTAALPECRDQSIWIANAWLLPPTGTRVQLVFARDPATGARLALDEAFVESLPILETAVDESGIRDDFSGR